MNGCHHLTLGDRCVWDDIRIAIGIPVGKVVNDKSTPGSGAVTALDAGVVMFCCDTAVSENHDMCRRVAAACSAKCCGGRREGKECI